MTLRSLLRSSLRWSAGGVGLAAIGYATYVGVTWARYGRVSRPDPGEQDTLLDRFMPVWTLRADAIGATPSIFRTETRAIATDRSARAKFRRYWAFLSPGIILFRWLMLGPLRAEAERQTRQGAGATAPRIR